MAQKLTQTAYDMEGADKQGAFKFVTKKTLEASPFYYTDETQSVRERIEEELALLADGLHPVADLQEAFDSSEGEGLYIILVDYFYPDQETHIEFKERIEEKYNTCNGVKLNPFKRRL